MYIYLYKMYVLFIKNIILKKYYLKRNWFWILNTEKRRALLVLMRR